jgi:uncharacterized protein YabE (DUF348 family)
LDFKQDIQITKVDTKTLKMTVKLDFKPVTQPAP